MSDVKTLRLASAQLTAESLDAFLQYQRTLITALASSTEPAQSTWAGRFAFAHGKALAASGLDAMTQQRLKVLVGEYSGKRSALLTVRQRLDEAAATVKSANERGESPPAKDQALVAKARTEVARLEDFSAFVARYGDVAFEVLTKREAEVVALHRDVSRLEGASGHVHPA